MEQAVQQSGLRYWVITVMLLLIPFWLPFAYSGAVLLEMKYEKHGPLNEGALFFLFVAPAIGSLPIVLRRDFPIAAKIILTPIYYVIGLAISFFIGWVVAASLFGH